MKKIYLTAKPSKGHTPEKARDAALEALSRIESIDEAEGTVGIFGKLTKLKERDA